MIAVSAFALFLIFPLFADDSVVTGLSIRSNVSGAEVCLNGILRGTTPFTLANPEPGTYRLVLSKKGYYKKECAIMVSAGHTNDYYLEMEEITGYLLISANIPDCTILIDDIPLSSYKEREPYPVSGAKSSVLLALSEGIHHVSAEAFGYKTATCDVFVNRTFYSEANLVLEKDDFRLISASTELLSFNPRDPGGHGFANINFAVSAPGSALLSVENSRGQVLFTDTITSFSQKNQSFAWNGRTKEGQPFGDGVYTAKVVLSGRNADGTEKTVAFEKKLEIDSSIVFNLSAAGLSGKSIGAVACSSASEVSALNMGFKGRFLTDGTKFALPLSMNLGGTFGNNWELSFAGGLSLLAEGEDLPFFVGGSVKYSAEVVSGKDFAVSSGILLGLSGAYDPDFADCYDAQGFEASVLLSAKTNFVTFVANGGLVSGNPANPFDFSTVTPKFGLAVIMQNSFASFGLWANSLLYRTSAGAEVNLVLGKSTALFTIGADYTMFADSAKPGVWGVTACFSNFF